MDDLRIEYDAPNGVFSPSQAVTGKVVIQNREWIKARFLKICIHGGAYAGWIESQNRSIVNEQGETHNHTENVKYSATVNYLEGESVAWRSPDGSNRLPAGTNVFPFAFSLPINCPPSYEGCHGHVRYSVHVELDRPWHFNKKTRKCFTVIPVYDLNITPTAINPMVNTTSKNTGFIFKKGLVSMTVSLPKRGYVAGEIVPITVTIDNSSKNPVVSVSSKIYQHSVFHASSCHGTLNGTAHIHHRKDTKTVAESQRSIDVPPRTKSQVVLSTRIPAIVPSFECPVVNVNYCISVKLGTATAIHGTLKCEFPLIIGTIPIRPTAPLAYGSIPATMPSAPSSSPPYPVVSEAFASPSVYPIAPSAPPLLPEMQGALGVTGLSLLPPPSYEESVYGAGKIEGAEQFAPRYPVYNNLEQTTQSNFATSLPPKV